MIDQDRQQFLKIIAVTLDAYGRRPPMADTVELWFQVLKSHPIDRVRMACQQYVMQSPKEPPTPGAIHQMLQGRDTSRPGAEEAWAIAVRACDETETVMMTDEIAQAWGVAQPIFNLGDEVGARMAFKEAYGRILGSAEAPAKWFPSIGSDPYKRDTALAEAKRTGLLPAPTATALAITDQSGTAKQNPEGLKRLKEELANLTLANEMKAAERQALVNRERMILEQRKQEIADSVAQYKGGGK